MNVKQITVQCDNCTKQDNMQLIWNDFKIPEGWRYRIRSFNVDDKPSDIQIACKECFNKINSGGR